MADMLPPKPQPPQPLPQARQEPAKPARSYEPPVVRSTENLPPQCSF